MALDNSKTPCSSSPCLCSLKSILNLVPRAALKPDRKSQLTACEHPPLPWWLVQLVFPVCFPFYHLSYCIPHFSAPYGKTLCQRLSHFFLSAPGMLVRRGPVLPSLDLEFSLWRSVWLTSSCGPDHVSDATFPYLSLSISLAVSGTFALHGFHRITLSCIFIHPRLDQTQAPESQMVMALS